MRLDLSTVRRVFRDEEVMSISRRYFVSNGFDGTLTSIGVTVGAYLSGIPHGGTVVKIGLGAAVGLGTSGVWSVWEIERAEKRAERKRIERAMLTDLEGTVVSRDLFAARLVNALASGLGPVLAVFVVVSPFLFATWAVSMLVATLLSVAAGVAVLFALGSYVGDMADLNWWVAGLRMGAAGVVVAALNVLLPG
ncbi:MAG: VIT1/CCC1 transporter family protein [Halobacteriaceae archaeon]